MHIAIDVNDTSIANTILDFLNRFNGEVKITASNNENLDSQFQKDKEVLHAQVNDYLSGNAELLNEEQYNKEMNIFISSLKDRYENR